jgi:hypothetical protein
MSEYPFCESLHDHDSDRSTDPLPFRLWMEIRMTSFLKEIVPGVKKDKQTVTGNGLLDRKS